MISDEKVGPNGVKVRCKKCGNVVSVMRAPSVAPEIDPDPAPPAPEVRAEGGTETTLERELGDAFDSVFGGGSVGLASEGGGSVGLGVDGDDSPDVAGEERAAESRNEEAAPQGASALDGEKKPAGAEETADWYVAVDEKQVGPLEAAGVKARWESGEIGPDSLAWRPGMADWVPLSTVPEMAQYLAPIPRGGGTRAAATPSADVRAEAHSSPAPASTSAFDDAFAPASPSVANGMSNGAANGHDTSWKPSAASALAALANEEIASRQKPEPKKEPAPEARGGSLLERMDLPDGGVDPTNILPLSLKGLEPTGESALPRRPAPAAPEASGPRQGKKSATRSVLAIGAAMAVLFAGVAAIVIWKLQPAQDDRPAAVAQAPAPAIPDQAAAPKPTPPAVAPAQPPPVASASAAPAGPVPGAAASPVPPAPGAPVPSLPPEGGGLGPSASTAARPTAEPPVAQRAAPPPERETPPPHPSRTQRNAKIEKPAPPARTGQRLARAERAPAPEPAEPPRRKSGGDPLLDVGGDDEVEKELSGRGPKRSVYVPPAMGSALADNVSVSQINEAVVGQKTALVRCIEQQKAADADTRGTLKLRWVIGGDGSVRDVRVLTQEFARQPIAPCISSIVKGIRFPRSRTTGQEVVFPFKF
jgi:hypothetical protein